MFKSLQILLIGGMMLVMFHSTTFAEFSYYCEVTTLNLNVRECADVSCEIISTVPKGSLFYVVRQIGSWYKIQDSEGNEGFVHGNYIRLYEMDTSTPKKKNIATSNNKRRDTLKTVMNTVWVCDEKTNNKRFLWVIYNNGTCQYGLREKIPSLPILNSSYISEEGNWKYENGIVYETYPTLGELSWRIQLADDNSFLLFPLSIFPDKQFLCTPIQEDDRDFTAKSDYHIPVFRTIDRKTNENSGYIALFQGQLYLWEYFCNDCWASPLLRIEDVEKNYRLKFMGYIPCINCKNHSPQNAKR